MKKLITTAIALLAVLSAGAQKAPEREFNYVEATELTITGKVFPDTPNPYHRMDTVRFNAGFTKEEKYLLRDAAGIAVAFRTDADEIRLLSKYAHAYFGGGTTGFAGRGFDLYIRRDGMWLWAASALNNDNRLEQPMKLIQHLPEGMKECLVYLPVRSEMNSVKIGVPEDAHIEPIPNPFRYRVAVFGSSFTHGASTSKSGMAYPSILSRETGIQFLNLGVSGRCRLQDYFAKALCEAPDVDAFLFDTFSNPTPDEIRDRLFPFIETLQSTHPGKPLIFQTTIYRERRNFNTEAEAYESSRMDLVDSLMRVACKRYKDVYYVKTTNATSPDHYTSVDGTHPGDYGYTLWARSVKKPVLRILRKYGIK